MNRHHVTALLDDPYLANYKKVIEARSKNTKQMERRLTLNSRNLKNFANAHEFFGLHLIKNKWVFREWAPNAQKITLIGEFSNWEVKDDFTMTRVNSNGTWEIKLDKKVLAHGDLYRLHMNWQSGEGDRIPAYARRVVQDENTKIFNAQVWMPAHQYKWKNTFNRPDINPVIYEAHIGMAQEKESVGTYTEFKENILPRIADGGYNTVQLMAVMEHPYYGSFGYHVSSFFAASSRFGTPEELKSLIDVAHKMGLAVIIDIIHSHAVKNEVEGLSRFDGTLYQYFHEGNRGTHAAWDSRCFDYAKPEVLHFLLSNCRFWLDAYHIDGFRFDGITSMLYKDHGLGGAFDSYEKYFNDSVDNNAITYLTLANKLIHSVRPDAITIAEDVSGLPGLASAIDNQGYGFDYRLAMGIPDCWFKLANDIQDEDWNLDYLWNELTNRRSDEQTISYVECHDQSLVGGKTMMFELIDAAAYSHMSILDNHIDVDRGIALHKMLRMATIASAGHGYLNFMGNEFGHPEWIDFPREGNNWSYHYARRQWHLRDDKDLKYYYLAEFDKALIRTITVNTAIRKGMPRLLSINNEQKIIVFERGGLFFFFNFHPSISLTDYQTEILPGKYKLIMNTDDKQFAGHGRIAKDQEYFTDPVKEDNDLKHIIKLYLPARTALVIKQQSN